MARLTEQLRCVLRASIAELWPDAPSATPGRDRVPRVALELARSIAAAVDHQHDLLAAGLAASIVALARDSEALVALGLGGEAPIVSPGALVGFAGERIFALRDAAKAAKGPRRRESAH